METTETKPLTDHSRWGAAWGFGLGLVLLIAFFFQGAHPVRDGDLWWQMAYGRDLLDQGTLIPDHGAYSWTPARTDIIYCAWLPEMALHLVHEAGGLPLLFALRYLCLGLLFVLVLVLARQRNVVRHPLVWTACVLGVLMSQYAGHLKPQIVSHLLMCVSVFAWFQIKRQSGAGKVWCYALPLVMLLWVNSHGYFIFGLALFVLVWMGEELNAFFRRDRALPSSVLRHLRVGTLLSGVATLANPYGTTYVLKVVRLMMEGTPVAHMVHNRDYDSIFSSEQQGTLYDVYLYVAFAILAVMVVGMVRRKRYDFGILLANAAFIFLYARFVRTTFLWAPLFAMTVVYLVDDAPRWLRPAGWCHARLLGGLALCGCLFLTGQSAYYQAKYPRLGNWLGFGVSYHNPVAEAEFIDEHYRGCRLGNSYNLGGYLLWRLWPETKVFIDPRALPFDDWFDEYRKLDTVSDIDSLLEEYPCDVWCIDLQFQRSIDWFFESPDWIPLFYGPSAVVYVDRKLAPDGGSVRAAHNVGAIENLYTATLALSFAVRVKDLDGAQTILSGLTERFGRWWHKERVACARDYAVGMIAFHRGEYKKAIEPLHAAWQMKHIYDDHALLMSYQFLATEEWARRNDARAAALLAEALSVVPNDLLLLYNHGAAAWYASREAPGLAQPGWQQSLGKFLQLAGRNPRVPRNMLDSARRILSGSFQGRPTLITPPRGTQRK